MRSVRKLVAVLAVALLLSGCVTRDFPRDVCTEGPPWTPVWTTPGLFANVNSSAPGFQADDPPQGLSLAESSDRFGWGHDNFTVTSAKLIVSARPGSELLSAGWNGVVSGHLLANRSTDFVKNKLGVINEALFGLNDTELDRVAAEFVASRTVSAAEPHDVAQYKADFGQAPQYGHLLTALQGEEASEDAGSSLRIGTANMQFGESWTMFYMFKVKSWGNDTDGRISANPQDRATMDATFDTPPTEADVTAKAAPLFSAAGLAPPAVEGLKSDGEPRCE